MSAFTEAWLTGPHSTQIYTRTYKAASPKALLVFIHGFIEHIARHEHVHVALAAQGISVFAFDQRGYGRTALDAEHKSKDSAYGKTSWEHQLNDIEWAVKHATTAEAAAGGDLPVFLMGHSMGGALALAYATRPADKRKLIACGVIATSPILRQSAPASKVLRWAGGQMGKLTPYMTIPAPVRAEDLSHDKAVNKAYMEDPMVIQKGTLRGIGDMLNGGETLVQTGYQHWPMLLPLLLIHGTEDKVASHEATEEFFNKVPAVHKKLSLYDGGFHELHNEPDGVKEKLINECIAWVNERLTANDGAVSKL